MNKAFDTEPVYSTECSLSEHRSGCPAGAHDIKETWPINARYSLVWVLGALAISSPVFAQFSSPVHDVDNGVRQPINFSIVLTAPSGSIFGTPSSPTPQLKLSLAEKGAGLFIFLCGILKTRYPMEALSFWKAVTTDRSNFLDDITALLKDNNIRFCVIDGKAVNAYVEPLVSLDLDVVVAVEQIEQLRGLLEQRYTVEEFAHSLNVSASGSNLRVQIQTDPSYGEFVKRASTREVLGVVLPVASIEDVLQGKIWAASDSQGRPTKRRKDLLDIERLIEANRRLKARVPEAIVKQISAP